MSEHSLIRWLETPHGRLAWRADGPSDGVPLILFQRFRGTMDDWDPAFIAAISRNRRVIRFDSAGIGRSEGSVPETIPAMAAVAADVIRLLGLSPVDVLGWSLGGVVAQQFALDFPDLVRRLIIAGSSPGPVADGPQQHPRVPQIMTKGQNDDEDFLFLFYPETTTAIAAGRASLARIMSLPDRGPQVNAAGMMGQVKAVSGWTGIFDRADELKLPVLVANGAHDVMLPAYRSYLLSQRAPNAKLVLYPDAGHAFLFQFIEDFAAEIDRFLQE
ncbi:alpha/beta hydrolase [Rhizobium sp. SSA_523]|uniref:alpha/beta fold hydrolase n=1 Tax=Rhizobium sp. SSA_523 TaxID=2952477 RepID=UPI0020917FD8|nr:alpha/beta hydrolase [Rhizobium sp. SSA_523]MCO5734459.1 alpha/beta hydrolase [Rhizobium sp. SSA_523]WKC23290.1 alpha/beta hydrolase [Rhizobium sp. SSA_523]